MSVMTRDRLAPIVRRQIPLWAGAVAVVAALLVGFVLGQSAGDDPGQPVVHTGVVSLVDSDESLVCISPLGEQEQECYRAPGAQLQVGDEVRYRLEPQPVDPDEPDHGNQQVIVYAETDADLP